MGGRRRRRKRTTGGGGTVWVFILVAALFLMAVSSRPLVMHRDEVVSFDLSPLPAAASGGEDEVLGEDERKVPTGANPLHNR